MTKHEAIAEALSHIFEGIDILKRHFPPRQFTIDGRLVGDVGEIIAELEYVVELDRVSRADYDGTSNGRKVQIKATFKDQLTFKKTRTTTSDSSSAKVVNTRKSSTDPAKSFSIASQN